MTTINRSTRQLYLSLRRELMGILLEKDAFGNSHNCRFELTLRVYDDWLGSDWHDFRPPSHATDGAYT